MKLKRLNSMENVSFFVRNGSLKNSLKDELLLRVDFYLIQKKKRYLVEINQIWTILTKFYNARLKGCDADWLKKEKKTNFN
jgi:hypothetical protein